jgi:cell division protein FtsW
VLLGAVLALVSLGLVMVYSASAVTAAEKQGNGFYFLERQLLAAGVGLVVMAAAVRMGYRRLARLAHPMLLLSIVLLILVLVPGVGTVVGGARRWLRLPGLSLQPAEIAKFTWVVYLAYSLAKKREKVATFSIGFLPHLLLAGLLVALCMAEPDFGSSWSCWSCSSSSSSPRARSSPTWSARCSLRCRWPTEPSPTRPTG